MQKNGSGRPVGPNRPVRELPVKRDQMPQVSRSFNVQVIAPRYVECLACGVIWRVRKDLLHKDVAWMCPSGCNRELFPR